MRISYKISAIIIVVSIVLLCFGNYIFSTFFKDFLINEENEHIKVNIDSLVSSINEAEKKYISIAGDWGHWSETYDYINSNNTNYEKVNLNVDSVSILNANVIVIFDKDNKVLSKIKFDTENKKFVNFNNNLLSQIEESFNKYKSSEDASFILRCEDELYIMAKSEVTDSLMEKPATGTFVVGKLIDLDMIANFEKTTDSKITFGLLKDLNENVANSLIDKKENSTEVYVSEYDDKKNVILSHILLSNFDNGQTIISMEKAREFYLLGIGRLRILQIYYTLLVIIIILFLFLCISRYISRPIIFLAKKLKCVDLTVKKFDRLPEKGTYEFSLIADAVNSMLGKIETAHKDFEMSERRLLAAQSMAHVGNWELDLKTKKIWASEETFNIYGIAYESPYIAQSLIHMCALAEYRNELEDALNGLVSKKGKYDVKFKVKNITTEEIRFVHSKAILQVDDDGNPIKVVGTLQDITENKKAEDEILYLSYHDQVTGVYNRRFYEEEMSRLDNTNCSPLTLIMIDVNGLKLTNDAFGHRAGDLLLEKVANVLKRECRSDDVIARIGGDEFVVLLPQNDEKDAVGIIKRINTAIENEQIDNIIMSISIGFAVKKDNSETMNEIFKKAEDEMYRHKLVESSNMRRKTIDQIMNTLYENKSEMVHSKRVSELCVAIATEMNFDKDALNQIRLAGLMHDIGKIGIDERTLEKPRELNNIEWYEIERHSETGYRILSSVNEFSEIAEFVLQHHERWCGGGYPKNLKGEEISVQARIIAIADAYDAMTSDRAYRKAFSEQEAINEIKKCSGTQFDPVIANIFVEKVWKNHYVK